MADPKPPPYSEFFQKFAAGIMLGITSGAEVAQKPSFHALVKRYVKQFLGVFAIVYTVALLLWIPISLIVGIIDAITGMGATDRIPSAFTLMCKVSELLGPLMLLVLNWQSYGVSDRFFFTELNELAPKQSKVLQEMPYPPVGELLKESVRRYVQFVMGASGILFISLLPGGPFFRGLVEAAFDLWLMIRVFGYFEVGAVFAVLRAIPDQVWDATGLPITAWQISALVKVFCLARSVSREILEPYFARARYELCKRPKDTHGRLAHGCEASNGLVMTRGSRKDAPTLLGFALPFAFLMSTPIFGPVLVLFAQAAGAHLVQPMLADRSRLR